MTSPTVTSRTTATRRRRSIARTKSYYKEWISGSSRPPMWFVDRPPSDKLLFAGTDFASVLLSVHRPTPTVTPTLNPNNYTNNNYDNVGRLGGRVVSVLYSGAEGPGFKSQPRRCRVTVLGKLFTPVVTSCLCSPSSEIGSSPLKGREGNCEPSGK